MRFFRFQDRRIKRIAQAGIVLLGLVGCGEKPKGFDQAAVRRWEGKENKTLSHDFGLLRPNQKVRHRFSIPNHSDMPWTLAAILPTCNCTAGRPLSDQVLPGKNMEIDIEYTAPPITKEDVHRVGVEFAENSAPYFWLRVQGSVRELTTAVPGAVFLEANYVGEQVQGECTLSSYLDHDVQPPQVACSAPWLQAELNPAPVMKDRFPARQAWHLVVKGDTANRQPGLYRAQITIKPEAAEAPLKVVPVEFTVNNGLEIAPRELAFGPVSPAKATQRKLLIRLLTDFGPVYPDDVKMEHDLGERLKVEWKKVSPKVLEISAILAVPPGHPNQKLRGTLHVLVKGVIGAPMEIPISAEINQS
jgi:hypothetical protein